MLKRVSGNHSDRNLFAFVFALLPQRKTTVCYFFSFICIYFQGQSRIRPDISGIADLGESAKGRDKTCSGRTHLSPDKDRNGHRYRTTCM